MTNVTHGQALTYIQKVRDALADQGITVAHVQVDSAETALELGREWACIDLADSRYSLVWNDHGWPDGQEVGEMGGWVISTHANHYPLSLSTTPEGVATKALTCINDLSHGRWRTPL